MAPRSGTCGCKKISSRLQVPKEVYGKLSLCSDVCEYFSDRFMGPGTCFGPYWIKYLVHFVNFGDSK